MSRQKRQTPDRHLPKCTETKRELSDRLVCRLPNRVDQRDVVVFRLHNSTLADVGDVLLTPRELLRIVARCLSLLDRRFQQHVPESSRADHAPVGMPPFIVAKCFGNLLRAILFLLIGDRLAEPRRRGAVRSPVLELV